MRVLVADDDRAIRLLLGKLLAGKGYEVMNAEDGEAAWAQLQAVDGPPLALLDWVMPVLDGPEVCRRVRATPSLGPRYLILLTVRSSAAEIAEGLDAGANDFVTKPFSSDELLARVRVGQRVVELQAELVRHVTQLQDTLAQIKTLRGLLPICSYCKKIRDDQDYWQHVERYISEHSDAQFTHGICPECYEKLVKPKLEDLRRRGAAGKDTGGPSESADASE